jgi:hypothetical protein
MPQYVKTTWVNGSAPALGATNMNKIESGIFDAIRQDGSTTMSAQLAVIQGSNTTPSIAFFSDTNTGIYFAAADKLAITEGGRGLTFDEFKMTLSMGGML